MFTFFIITLTVNVVEDNMLRTIVKNTDTRFGYRKENYESVKRIVLNDEPVP